MNQGSVNPHWLIKYQYRADDTDGGTIQIQSKIEPELYDWLVSQPKTKSYNIRQALRLYREYIEGQKPPIRNERDLDLC